MNHSRRAIIGLGSNLGDRAGYIRSAIEQLALEPAFRILNRSPIYQSPPAGGPPQGDYLNAAILVETALPAGMILERVLAVERALGRIRTNTARWGPRTIDLDILWIEGEISNEPDLQVPHPRLLERNFALRPLIDVAPDATDPRTGALYAQMRVSEEALEVFDPDDSRSAGA